VSDDFAGDGIETEPDALHLAALKGRRQDMGKKEFEEVVGQRAEGEEGGVRLALAAGHTFQAGIDLGFLDGVLAMLTPRAVPEE